jgi:dynein heavy chain
MTPWMTMMFEVEDLAQASPATVSRCGMVLLESKQLNWQVLLNHFIEVQPEGLDKRIEAF